MRVFYIRLINLVITDSTVECLNLYHIPLNPDTFLEVNGVRYGTGLERVPSLLRRDRVDKKAEEATFVTTDSIIFSDSIKFEVTNKNVLLISGILKLSGCNGCVDESNDISKEWSMNCELTTSSSEMFLKSRQSKGPESSAPTIELYLAGCFSGTPTILTKILKSHHQKKQKNGVLHPIPECDAPEFQDADSPNHSLQISRYKSYKPESEEDDYDYSYWRQTACQDEDGEQSWFNAGVGVGLGLGICLGVGLLVRTYKTSAKTFKRWLL